MTCPHCHQDHPASCPISQIPLNPLLTTVHEGKGEMTINGMTPFEHALIERLDKLLTVLTRQKPE